jgi:prolyl 4-hydroxylase
MQAAIAATPVRRDYPTGIRLAEEPAIQLFDHFLPPDACAHIMAAALPRMQRAVVSDAAAGRVSTGRTGGIHWLPHDHSVVTAALAGRVSELVGIPLAHAESLQVIHYAEGQEYRPHFDGWDLESERGRRCTARGGQRLVTCLLYLNDVAEGGATAFPRLGISIQARQGRMVVFHNCIAGTATVHPASLHGGLPVQRGEKWACNLWFRQRPCRPPGRGEYR